MSINPLLSPALLGLSLLASPLPLTVSNVATGPQSHVRLTNTASQPITAWSLAVTSTTSGGRTHREVETIDGYLSEVTRGLPGSSERLDRILPGQSRELALDPLPDEAHVDVVAVVLDDGTALGEEEFLAPIFGKRAKERDALKAVVDIFRDVTTGAHGTQAADALQRRLADLARRNDAVPCRAALDAVRNVGKKSDPAEIDRSLENYASFVTREYDLAAKHAQRR